MAYAEDYLAQLEALTKEMAGASDRATAIVAVAFLDEVLREVLSSYFVGDEKNDDDIFDGGNAPLGSFSAKISLSYRLGLISKGEYRSLHVIRRIRNDFAHKLVGVSFQVPSIRDKCRNIEVPVDMVAPQQVQLPNAPDDEPPIPKINKADSNDARAVFQEAVLTLSRCLQARVAVATVAARNSPNTFLKAHEPDELAVEQFDKMDESYEAVGAEYEELLRKKLARLADKGISDAERATLERELEDWKRRKTETSQAMRAKHDLTVRTVRFVVNQTKRAHEARRNAMK